MHSLPNEQGEQRFRINLYDHGAGLAIGDFDNDGRDGTFEDVTEKAGVSHSGHSQTAVFFDYDNDGLLDLFLTNTAHWTTDNCDFAGRYYEGKGSLPGLMSSPIEYNILYITMATALSRT